MNAITVDPITPQNVYLAGPGGLFRSADGGLTWEAMAVQLSSEPVALTIDPRTPSNLFVLLADGTLLKSDDTGANWTTVEIKP